MGVAVGPGQNVYVSDAGNHRVQTFSASGAYQGQWGSAGNGAGQFGYDGPAGLQVAPGGHVLVADPGNSRVQVFTAAWVPASSTLPTRWPWARAKPYTWPTN